MVKERLYYTFDFLTHSNQRKYIQGCFIENLELITLNFNEFNLNSCLYKEIDLKDIFELYYCYKINRSIENKQMFIVFSYIFDKLIVEDFYDNYLIEAENKDLINTIQFYLSSRKGINCKVIGDNKFIYIPKEKLDKSRGYITEKWVENLSKGIL